jgi:branched-chain amino acid transport system permease protein
MPANPWGKRIFLILVTAFVLVAPLIITGKYHQHIMVMCCIWVIASLALNLIMGYTGQLNLAHGTFFGIGAYATALLVQNLGFSFWVALPLGCAITAVFGYLTGLPTLRTKGHYFPIATMCLGIAIYYVIARWDDLTGGARGLFGLPRPDPLFLPFDITITFKSTIACYYLVLFFVFVTIILISRLVKSLAGKRLIAVRGNEDLAQSLGINTMQVKVISFTISTLFAGLAGGLFAAYMGTLMAEQAHYLLSFEMLINVVIGGIGTMAGPILGGILLPILGEILQPLAGFRLILYGLLLVLCIHFLPMGIVGGLRGAMMRRRRRREAL